MRGVGYGACVVLAGGVNLATVGDAIGGGACCACRWARVGDEIGL